LARNRRPIEIRTAGVSPELLTSLSIRGIRRDAKSENQD
jgi:hypothetical protein